MKKLFLIGLKDLKLAFRDRAALILMLLAPFLLTIGLGAVTGRFSGRSSNGISHIPVILINQDGGQIGNALVDVFQSKDLDELIDPTLSTDATAAYKQVDENKSVAVIVIPAGFTESIVPFQGNSNFGKMVKVELYTNPTAPTSVGVIKTILDGFLNQVNVGLAGGQVTIEQLVASGRLAPQQAQEIGLAAGVNLGAAAGRSNAILLNNVTSAGGEVKFDILAILAPAMAMMFLMYTVSNGGRTLLTERNQGTLPRLLVTPTTSAQVLGGKMIGIFLTGTAQMLILILGTTVMFGLEWGDPAAVLVLVLLAVFGAVGWGLLLTAIAKTPGQISAIGSALMLVFGILGGGFINTDNMPRWFQMVTRISPNIWGLNGFTTLALGGGTPGYSRTPARPFWDGCHSLCHCPGPFWPAWIDLQIGKAVMKKILAIAWKDTLMRFTGWSEWLFFLALPIVFTLVLAGGTGGSGDGRVRLVVVDEANTPLSAELVAALQDSQAIRPDLMPLSKAESQFSQKSANAVLIIPAGFDLAALEKGSVSLELRQQPNNLDAMIAQRAVMSVISRVSSAADIADASVAAAEKVQPFASDLERQKYFDASLRQAQSLLAEAPSRVTESTGNTQDPIHYNPNTNSSAGQLITWVFIPLLGISGMFAYERQKGTLRRLLTTPTRRSTYILGTIIGQVATALVQMLLLVGFGILVMKLNWGSQPLALGVMLIAAALAAAALGTALGTLVKTEGQASGISVMTGMVMALLGGCWYPLEMFPQAIQHAVKILPTTWAMQGLLDIVLRGQGLSAILPVAGILLGFAILFFGIGVWRFRVE